MKKMLLRIPLLLMSLSLAVIPFCDFGPGEPRLAEQSNSIHDITVVQHESGIAKI